MSTWPRIADLHLHALFSAEAAQAVCGAMEQADRATERWSAIWAPMPYIGILWTTKPPEQRPKLAWEIKPTGRHGSRVQRRRARGKR